jgi:hypothetical protein
VVVENQSLEIRAVDLEAPDPNGRCTPHYRAWDRIAVAVSAPYALFPEGISARRASLVAKRLSACV